MGASAGGEMRLWAPLPLLPSHLWLATATVARRLESRVLPLLLLLGSLRPWA